MPKSNYRLLIEEEISRMHIESRFPELKEYIHHGDVSVQEHCINVAHMSCLIAWKLNLNINYSLLIKGALLHDYFFYDWHEPSEDHKLHGFFHPRKALNNANEEFELTAIESNIILRHMFPLTIIPPNCLESWVVCLADKTCAIKESIKLPDLRFLWSWVNG